MLIRWCQFRTDLLYNYVKTKKFHFSTYSVCIRVDSENMYLRIIEKIYLFILINGCRYLIVKLQVQWSSGKEAKKRNKNKWSEL